MSRPKVKTIRVTESDRMIEALRQIRVHMLQGTLEISYVECNVSHSLAALQEDIRVEEVSIDFNYSYGVKVTTNAVNPKTLYAKKRQSP